MIHKPSRESLDVPQKIWARSVQPFRRLLDTNKQTNRQTDRQTDKPNLYIDIYNIYIFRYIHYINTTVQMTGRFQNKIITQGQFILIRG